MAPSGSSNKISITLIILKCAGLAVTLTSSEEEATTFLPQYQPEVPTMLVRMIAVPGEELLEEPGSEGDKFGRDDLVDLVTELERDAQDEERDELIPEIMGFLQGALSKSGSGNKSNGDKVESKSKVWGNEQESLGSEANEKVSEIPRERDGEIEIDSKEDDEEEEVTPLPRDLSDLTEDIADDITAGVEESLRLFGEDEPWISTGNGTGGDDQPESRQMLSMYLFQGQYIAEPRLNRFIDGALRNMGTEMRFSSMDPLYFRVLPRGMVEQRGQPLYPNNNNNRLRRRRPEGRSLRVPRQAAALKEMIINKVIGNSKAFTLKRRQTLLQQRRRRQRLIAQKRKRQQLLKKKRIQQQRQKQKLQQQQKNKKQQQKFNNFAKQRIRRRILQDVGGGRVEGLSRVQRDGDAEMQLFGNYTLIRSHMKIGPVELTMQFRTKNGIKRTGATLPAMRAHTVTRVNHEGSEMVDFLLDRPHPETIKVRGNLFPLAQKIARNIFSRLFLPNSFLIEKMREKTGLALLSRPIE